MIKLSFTDNKMKVQYWGNMLNLIDSFVEKGYFGWLNDFLLF